MASLVKVSRNDPCPCGSGRKYKRCCYAKAAPLVQGPDGELAHALPMSDEMVEILQRQREKFIARYGREPVPDDPIFFDAPSDDEYDAAVTKANGAGGRRTGSHLRLSQDGPDHHRGEREVRAGRRP